MRSNPPLDAEGTFEVDEVDQIEAIDVPDVSCVCSLLFFDDDVDVTLFSDVDLDAEPVDVVGKVPVDDKLQFLMVMLFFKVRVMRVKHSKYSDR